MHSKNRLGHIIHCLVEHRKLLLLPAIAGLVLATFYAFFLKGETWTSRQSMIIRDDLLGQTFKPGSFISQEAMKSAQETVLETARRPEVIRMALEKLGPDRGSFLGLGGSGMGTWPSEQTVEDFRGAVSFESANGGEFGKSEVIVLAAKGSSPKRSVEFLSILMDEVDSKLSEIQGDRFESMESELRATRDSTMHSKKALEADLMEMESGFEGTDIHLVRSLNERSGGGSPSAFENKLNEIATQRRDAVRKLSELRSNRQMLVDASRDSEFELPTSAALLASQPTLSTMLTGLDKAMQDLAQESSDKKPSHPKVRAAGDKVASTKLQIQRSIGTFIRGVDGQIDVQQKLIASLDQLRDKHTRRLTDVSRKRAPYATLSRQVEKLNEAYSEANARLTLMQSRKMASDSIKLLTRIGEPWIGTRADGMGKRTLALVGGIAGLFIGLGLVMIVAPPFVDPDVRGASQATAPLQTQEETVMQELGNIIPRQHEEVAKATTESELSEIVVEREVVPQRQVQHSPPAVEASSEFASTSPTPTVPQEQEPMRVEEPTAVANTQVAEVTQVDADAQADSQPVQPATAFQASVAQQPLPPQSPPMVVISTNEQAQDKIVPQRIQVRAQKTVPTDAGAKPALAKRPGAKTIAAIFANMPQPKTDIAEPTAEENLETANEIAEKIRELANASEPETPPAPIERDPSQTVMLDGDLVTTALPLQRRSSARPVDLAKADDGDFGQQSIDNVFSQLKPPEQLPREGTDTDFENDE